MDFRKEIAKLVKKEVKVEVEHLLEVPPEKLGDYAFPCFVLSKRLKKSPVEIAQEISKNVHASFVEKVEAKGPYVNFFLKKEKLAEHVLKEVVKKGFGQQKQRKKVLVEFPAPNTNKPLHLGHIRNMALGQSVSEILRFLGNTVFRVNLNNDRGVHICKSMYAYKKFGKNKKPNKKSDHFVGDFYVLYNKHQSEQTEKEVQEMLAQWEQGNKQVVALWKKLNGWAIKGFNETYKKFGLTFTKTYNESQIYKKGKSIVLDGLQKGVFVKDKNGAIVANLEEDGLGKKVFLRPDGTSIYITQDMYLAKKKFDDYKMDSSIYVVGSEQKYHFQVLFKVLKLLKYTFADQCYHLSYGMVYLPHGRMKSREGTVIDADDLVNEMQCLAQKEVKRRYKKLSKKELEKRSKAIGMSALRYYLLKFDPVKDIHFNPEESISFEGETGPYVQYAYARIQSIFRKHKKKLPVKIDYKLFGEKELSVVRLLAQYPGLVEQAGKQLKPSLLAHYLLELSQEFNSFYTACPILKEKPIVRDARLFLCKAVALVLKSGLSLLKIDTLDQM